MDTRFGDTKLWAQTEIRSPKRKRSTKEIERVWYEYHASFSAGFVEDVLQQFSLPKRSMVLDPWNGTGITTQVTQRKGHQAVGLDLNPAMVLVAKARLLKYDKTLRVDQLANEIVHLARGLDTCELPTNAEPLLRWLTSDAASIYRRLEHAIRIVSGENEVASAPPVMNNVADISDLTAFLYVALFRTLRRGLASFATSNPTWIRTRVPVEDALSLDWRLVTCSFREEISKLSEALRGFSPKLNGHSTIEARIERATSLSLPLKASSIDAIITSPPYCTRIDYVIATLPELRFLGHTDESLKTLRDQMIGTPTMDSNASDTPSSEDLQMWGATTTHFLQAVSRHTSKASSTYYFRYFVQYFRNVEKSLSELSRVLRPRASCVLVVQDSYYKEIRLDLAKVYAEMSDAVGLELYRQLDYRNGNTLARINKGARKYRKSSKAVESVMFFERR